MMQDKLKLSFTNMVQYLLVATDEHQCFLCVMLKDRKKKRQKCYEETGWFTYGRYEVYKYAYSNSSCQTKSRKTTYTMCFNNT